MPHIFRKLFSGAKFALQIVHCWFAIFFAALKF